MIVGVLGTIHTVLHMTGYLELADVILLGVLYCECGCDMTQKGR
jgi:hypothetical protein